MVRRRTDFLLRKAREREHLLLGFQKALDHLDVVIELIRAAKTPKEARAGLTGDAEALDGVAADGYRPSASRLLDSTAVIFDFSERQAQAIIELQLQRLTGMEQQKILDELAEIQRMIAEYLEILGSETKLRGVIINELKEVQKTFGDERRTADHRGHRRDQSRRSGAAGGRRGDGHARRLPEAHADRYLSSGRRAAARAASAWARAPKIRWSICIVAYTHTYLLIFTNKGRVYWLKIYEIPDAGTTGKGKNINGLINLQPDETVKAFLPVKEFVADKYIVMVTKHGVIKKCELTEFDNPMSRGIIAVSLDEGDELIAARLTTGNRLRLPRIARRHGGPLHGRTKCARWAVRPAACAP